MTDLHDRIKHDFTNHPPINADVAVVLDTITAEFIHVASTLGALTPPGREQSLMLTNLEQASMWAKAAVARNQTALLDSVLNRPEV